MISVGGTSRVRFQLENKLKMWINFFKQSLAILGCVTISVYVLEQMWDFTTETKLLFKDDIGAVLRPNL
jgi:hypothetical protein